jgi:putative ABC transport system substrate-binding protein
MMDRRQFVGAGALSALLARVPGAFAGTYDLVIKGGRVIDPSGGLDTVRDVAIVGGRIVAVDTNIEGGAGATIDARGKVVTPGLIDILVGPLTYLLRQPIAELALKHHLPTITNTSQFAHAGLLMSYGPNLTDLYRRAASYVDKILQGAAPADLPVEQPTKFDLVINLKAAKALGITIPPTLLASADQVIE